MDLPELESVRAAVEDVRSALREVVKANRISWESPMPRQQLDIATGGRLVELDLASYCRRGRHAPLQFSHAQLSSSKLGVHTDEGERLPWLVGVSEGRRGLLIAVYVLTATVSVAFS